MQVLITRLQLLVHISGEQLVHTPAAIYQYHSQVLAARVVYLRLTTSLYGEMSVSDLTIALEPFNVRELLTV